jgi:hypothetical protein
MAGGQQGQDDLATGVVRVGHQEHGCGQGLRDRQKEQDQFVEPFMDASGQRDGRVMAGRAGGEQTEDLQAVAEDEGGLGIVGGALMELLDRRHLAAFLGSFETVGQADQIGTDA